MQKYRERLIARIGKITHILVGIPLQYDYLFTFTRGRCQKNLAKQKLDCVNSINSFLNCVVMKAMICLIMVFFLTSCYTLKMDVGNGAPKLNTETIHKKKWYLLWGISPLNTVDAKKMAKGAVNYTVKSQVNVVDILIGFPTLYFLRSETVSVRKVKSQKSKVKSLESTVKS